MAMEALDIDKAVEFAHTDLASGQITDEEMDIMEEWKFRKQELQSEMTRFSEICDRFDGLYYPPDILEFGGASHWAWHPSARVPGRAHISVNNPPVYVDIPASLQSVEPVENFVATVDEPSARALASMGERAYFAWKKEVDLELKAHKACVVKGLYGRTAAKVWWDEHAQRPTFEIVDQPRNLFLGWGQSDYKTLNWASYVYRMTPESIYEEYGLVTVPRDDDGKSYPYLMLPLAGDFDNSTRTWLLSLTGMVEVADYWYRRPVTNRVSKKITRIEHETWNAIIVGNRVVKNSRHKEYGGRIPYVPLFNSYLPGIPDGRSELYDMEQLFREKDERLSSGSQMIGNAINAQYWQLVGPESPEVVPPGLKPQANRVIGPGAGNRIEKIEPWMPEFQLEQYLSRIDREMADVSGLNDLLRGLAPASVLSSSKAINALIANYEARIRMKRDLFYRWRQDLWDLVADVWSAKSPVLKPILKGPVALEITAPSLSPRDDMETSAMAANLLNSKLWSQRRAMDRVGVDDPEQEQNMIREERTDATLFPADVQVMAQLMAVLQQLGVQSQQAQQAEDMAEQQAASLNDQRALGGGMQGSPMMNGEEEQPIAPPEGMPANTPEGQALTGPPAPGGPEGPGGPEFNVQSMLMEGEAKNRILTQRKLGG
jgi:hypothetical protein